MENKIKLFEHQKVRTAWNEKEEKWYFSIVDVIEILTGTDRPRKYWNDLKTKLKAEGSELSEKIGQLKMQSSDGKYYMTDIADAQQLLRLIQSIPSPKAEPFKQLLAKVGNQSVTNCNRLKMESSDGKFYKTDVADAEQLLRLI